MLQIFVCCITLSGKSNTSKINYRFYRFGLPHFNNRNGHFIKNLLKWIAVSDIIAIFARIFDNYLFSCFTSLI